jgi:hypothetical protein
MSCVGNVSRTEENACEFLVCKVEGKGPQLSWHTWEDNIEMDLKKIVTGCGVDLSDWEREREVTGSWNTVMRLRVPKMRGISSLAELLPAPQEGLCLIVR